MGRGWMVGWEGSHRVGSRGWEEWRKERRVDGELVLAAQAMWKTTLGHAQLGRSLQLGRWRAVHGCGMRDCVAVSRGARVDAAPSVNEKEWNGYRTYRETVSRTYAVLVVVATADRL